MKRIIEELKGWSEDMILRHELEGDGIPVEAAEWEAALAGGRKLVAEARAAGMAEEEIAELIWLYGDRLMKEAA